MLWNLVGLKSIALNISIYFIFIYYLLSLYNRSILDIEYSPYYIELGSLQTHKAI